MITTNFNKAFLQQSLCLAALLLAAGCATTPEAESPAPLVQSPADSSIQMNPYELFTPESQKLEYPPGAGVGAYWGSGRFCIALDNFYDKESKKCILQHVTCFRQEGDIVYATGKEGWLVMDLAQSKYKTDADLNAFDAHDQVALKKLCSRTKGNIYFHRYTKMPRI